MPPRPCIERLPDGAGCPRYAEPGDSRCKECRAQAVKDGRRSPGTATAWRRARKLALERAGYRCEKCGRTEQHARAAGTWLEVHHEDGAGVRANEHDQSKLRVLCRKPCHLDTLRARNRQTWEQTKAAIRARYRQDL